MFNRNNRSKTNNEGFTLIEIMIAMSLFSFVLLAILNLFITQARLNDSINHINIAIILAEERLEQLSMFPFNEMPDEKTDYIVYKENRNRDPIVYTDGDAAALSGTAFRITETITKGIYTTLVHVRVNYGKNYSSSIELETIKGD